MSAKVTYELWLDGADSWIHESDKEPNGADVFETFQQAKKALNRIFTLNIQHYQESKSRLFHTKSLNP